MWRNVLNMVSVDCCADCRRSLVPGRSSLFADVPVEKLMPQTFCFYSFKHSETLPEHVLQRPLWSHYVHPVTFHKPIRSRPLSSGFLPKLPLGISVSDVFLWIAGSLKSKTTMILILFAHRVPGSSLRWAQDAPCSWNRYSSWHWEWCYTADKIKTIEDVLWLDEQWIDDKPPKVEDMKQTDLLSFFLGQVGRAQSLNLFHQLLVFGVRKGVENIRREDLLGL